MLPYTSKGRDLGVHEDQLHRYPELARAHVYDLVSVVVHVGSIDTGMYFPFPHLLFRDADMVFAGHYISYCRVGEQVRANQPLCAPPWLYH